MVLIFISNKGWAPYTYLTLLSAVTILAMTDRRTLRVWNTSGSCTKVLNHFDMEYGISNEVQYIYNTYGINELIKQWNPIWELSSLFIEDSYSIDATEDCILAVDICGAYIYLYRISEYEQHESIFFGKDLINAVTLNNSGTKLASASDDKTVRIWNPETQECLHILNGHSSSVHAVAFSPDGSKLISGSADNTLRMWDVESGKCLATLHGHKNPIIAIAISPDGTLIASGSNDTTIRLWNASNGTCRELFEGHTNAINTIAFNADGSKLASGSDDTTVRIWDVTA